MRSTIRSVLLIFIIIIIFSGCGKEGKSEKKIIIAEQYGLAYAPVQIIRLEKILETRLPKGWSVEWKKLSNTAAIREAMLSGNLDVGFMGLPPFLIGYDKGMNWKMFTALCEAPVGLVTWKDDIRTLSDFKNDDRIALPQPGSIQHILLSMAAERETGNPGLFDNRIVTMAHPDGMNALLSKNDITAHFTSPPFIMKELEEQGFRMILSGNDAMGGSFSFIGGAVTDDFNNKYPEIISILSDVIGEAVYLIETDPEEAVSILAENYNFPEDELYKYLTWEGMNFSTEISGMNNFIEFMHKNSYIKSDIRTGELYTK